MTESEKLILEEIRSLRSEFKSDINLVHYKIDKNYTKTNDKLDNNREGLALFKGKVFGVWLVLTVMLNAGLHFFGKK